MSGQIITQIAQAIEADPGTNPQELSRVTGIAPRQLYYALVRMQALDMIRVVKLNDGIYEIYPEE